MVTRRAVLAAALAAPYVARASERSWTMVGMADFPPYNYVDGENFIGADIDILTEAARRLGITASFVPLPWPRVLLALERYEADALFQLAPTPKRFREWHMTGPLRTTRQVFVVPADSPIRDITTLGDLAGFSVGVVHGFTYTPAFNVSTHFHHERSVDDRTSLRKLLLGRVDLAVGGEANFRFSIRRLGAEDRLRFLPTPLVVQERFVGFRRDVDGREKADRMQAVLSGMTADGQIAAILRGAVGG